MHNAFFVIRNMFESKFCNIKDDWFWCRWYDCFSKFEIWCLKLDSQIMGSFELGHALCFQLHQFCRANLVCTFPLVHQLRGLLQVFYQYFCKSPKMHLELIKLVNIMKIKRFKLLKNVKPRWISMPSLVKIVIV